MKCWTGTTIEAFKNILKEGIISITPPKRVWEEHSNEFIYLVPSYNKCEDENQQFIFCAEQASFAVSEFNGTRRVVIEVDIDELELTDDEDCTNMNSKKLGRSISIDEIKCIYIDEEERLEELIELIAITKLYQEFDKNCESVESMYYECDEDIYSQIPIKNINKVNIQTLMDSDKLSDRYMELLEIVENGVGFKKYSISELNI